MNTNRSAGLTLLACAVGLSLAACSSGGGSASPPAPAASTPAAASAHAASSSPASTVSSGRTVDLGAPVGAFPVPPGAQVIASVSSAGAKEAELRSVSAAEAVSFYASALPRAGYTIMSNSLSPVGGGAEGALAFSGHGYKGTIVADSLQATSGAGTGAQNYFVIELTPQ
jgi:hypothetical protein